MAVLKRVSKATGKVRYQVLIDRRDPVTGERNRITVGTFFPRKLAEQKEREALAALENGSFVEKSGDTVGDVLDLWLSIKKGTVRRNTYTTYEVTVRNHLKPVVGSVLIQKLTPAMVSKALRSLQDGGCGDRTVEICLTYLSAACSHAVALRMIPANPCASVTCPVRSIPREVTVWSEEEVARFRAVAEKDHRSPLWHLLIETGMRRGEALGLPWENVDTERGVVHVIQTAVQDTGSGRMVVQPMGKTDASRRSVMISDDLARRLEDRRRATGGEGLVFASSRGTVLQPGVVQRALDRLCEAAGVDRVTIHWLRHLAATRQVRAGVPEVVAQKRMGHANSSILRRVYQHADVGLQREAVDALALLDASLLLPYGADTGDKSGGFGRKRIGEK